ncbi:threonine-phosphate decarboxylase CobD [Chloracidobacterium thermophilum]|uniref:threonine-phosphate decarboxylase n=1 Tax=Chloracidobacterium thermophilum (strain B) TaxID=981222 RepID=G2LEE2_CHLTF|nr:threonine-phosphate decarboxylase CobD [Chloracidobacterium thermophilum]AEP11605.1 Histidinol-phosphate/aromatic aminotransferase and cobyric acid decarboxylase [Chloracidobacterium thermophilum B]QUV79491.1 threonine-phosphate decarboxylase [Chloracidobacterium thermophilum]
MNPSPWLLAHGGRVFEAAQRWGIAPTEVLDFSASLNPWGPPASVRSAVAQADWTHYPDDTALRASFAQRHRLDPAAVVVGNGVSGLLFDALRIWRPRRVLLLEPSFTEYRRALVAVNACLVTWPLRAEDGFQPNFGQLGPFIRETRVDTVLLNTPHNPTGVAYPPEHLLEFVRTVAQHSVRVVLDESFVDYQPENSLIQKAANLPNVVVLRSMTKFYTMPGLRVGVAVAYPPLAQELRRQTAAWPVGVPALEAAQAALADEDFASRTRLRTECARRTFAHALDELGCTVFPSAANFLLLRLPRGTGTDLARWLEPHHVLIRRCTDFVGLDDRYVRVAVRDDAANAHLVALLVRWLEERRQAELTSSQDSR